MKPSNAPTGYRLVVESRIIPLLGSRRLGVSVSGDIAAFLQAHRAMTPGVATVRRRSPSRRSSARSACYTLALAAPVELELRSPPATLRVSCPAPHVLTRGRRRSAPVEPSELRAFLDATAGDRLHIGFVLAATSGLRRSELIGLRWDDIDFDSGTLAVQRPRVAAGYEVFEGSTKSGRGRVVRI